MKNTNKAGLKKDLIDYLAVIFTDVPFDEIQSQKKDLAIHKLKTDVISKLIEAYDKNNLKLCDEATIIVSSFRYADDFPHFLTRLFDTVSDYKLALDLLKDKGVENA